eukprot:273599_1
MRDRSGAREPGERGLQVSRRAIPLISDRPGRPFSIQFQTKRSLVFEFPIRQTIFIRTGPGVRHRVELFSLISFLQENRTAVIPGNQWYAKERRGKLFEKMF